MPSNNPIPNRAKSNLTSVYNIVNPTPTQSYKDNQINIPFDLTYDLDIGGLTGLTGTEMINTNEVNIINITIDNFTSSQAYNLNVYYSDNNDTSNSTLGYTTEVEQTAHFFQQYPKKNNFIWFGVTPLVNSDFTGNVNVTGFVSLSKYTQYNVQSQLKDRINKNKIAIDVRNDNSFLEDVNLGTITDIDFKNVNGNMFQLPSTAGETIISNVNFPVPNLWINFTEEPVVLVSDSPSDIGGMFIQGIDKNGEKQSDILSMNGTSNSSATINSYSVVNRLNGESTGNVSCFTANSGQLMNYLDAGSYYSSSCLYASNRNDKSVIQNIKITGLIDYRGAEINVVRFDRSSFRTIYKKIITDEQINIDLGRFEDIIDYNNIFYVLLKHAGHSSINTNNINVKVDLLVHNRNLD
jgi:hypothetical protein